MVAGVVSFSSPCCLPLLPGYLSSVSALPVSELIAFHQRHRFLGDAEVAGVVYPDSTEEVLDFRRRESGEWPMLEDPKGRTVDMGCPGCPSRSSSAPTAWWRPHSWAASAPLLSTSCLPEPTPHQPPTDNQGEEQMDRLVYLLLRPLGCVAGLAGGMAMMARSRRRAKADAHPAPADEVDALRAEVAQLRAERSEAGSG